MVADSYEAQRLEMCASNLLRGIVIITQHWRPKLPCPGCSGLSPHTAAAAFVYTLTVLHVVAHSIARNRARLQQLGLADAADKLATATTKPK